nr:LysR family transcriptional regulator [Bdellovibrionales bacterium]
VDRCRNFAQAARECFVTQPTLSMQIQKLEDYLQVIIFDRSKSPVVPTPMGKKV